MSYPPALKIPGSTIPFEDDPAACGSMPKLVTYVTFQWGLGASSPSVRIRVREGFLTYFHLFKVGPWAQAVILPLMRRCADGQSGYKR